jgi:hypothetical protein
MSPATNEHPPSYSAANQDLTFARVSKNCGQVLRECIQAAISVPIVFLTLFFFSWTRIMQSK